MSSNYETGVPLDEAIQSVGPGWEHLVRAVYALLEPGRIVSTVKEKWGGLRIYTDTGTELEFNVCDQAERRSLQTCEECGKPGKPGGKGWIKTFCLEHTR